MSNNFLNESVQYMKGVGPAKFKKLEKMGITTYRDLLEYYPRSYEDRRNIKQISEFVHGEYAIFKGKIIGRINARRIRKSLNIIYFYITDETAEVQITIFNQQYLMDKLLVGKKYAFYGKVEYINGRFEVQNPIIVEENKINELFGIFPIYKLTSGITNNYIFSLEKQLFKNKITFKDIIPEVVREKYKLQGINESLKNIHLPKNLDEIDSARRRIIFEELYLMQLALNSLKYRNLQKDNGIKFQDVDYSEFIKLLPFNLTGAQQKALAEIRKDMSSNKVMNRLVQGDVGSGKTIIAAIAMYIAVKNGYQAAMMAPTTILALQHKNELEKYFTKLGMKVEVLTGNTTAKNKRLILEKLEKGEIDILVGTHSIIEDNVVFKKLGMIVTDEQHRFGVNQRVKLTNKGIYPDVMVMSATPIPRTLALMLYSDLDMTIIDELPPNRIPIKTYVVDESYEQRIINFIKKELDKGRQAYIVCPLIEENEELDLKDATSLYESYKNEFLKEYDIGFLHGKMKNKEKDEIMQKFKEGQIKALISTTVIEVGVNVPNATLMIIEDADRFGLATLHQLRGRVGRANFESYCVLKSRNKSAQARERLGIMAASNDGFEIARRDLELRGPGDFFGIRQHGLPEFKLADLLKDVKLLKESSEAAKETLEEDPRLEKIENLELREYIFEKYKEQLENIGT
ncbi:MAG: ATP-dependent DNA helicase RecG [Clostridia bacterium]|nr:ATP-dependent DNA helicase RecG [Clostridia bacterium]